MRYGRLWVCGLIVVLASTGFTLADRAVNETRSASPDAEVSIEIFAGSVTVTAWDESRVSVEGTIGDDVESLEVDGEGDEIEISVEIPEHSKGDLDLSAKLEIMVPRGVQLEVESLSADVTVTGVSAEVEVEVVSGDVTVEGPVAMVELEVVSGDIRVANPGSVEIEAVSGDVTVQGMSGSGSIEAVSGDIKLDGTLGDTEIEAVSGDIRFHGGFAAGAEVSISSVNGDVGLKLPGDVSARFEVSTFNGDIKSDFGGTPERTDPNEPGMKLDATAGGGDASVDIETFSGDVRIQRM
jgi:DUF4097 and DUF4098 domain-containing protein YvlB